MWSTGPTCKPGDHPGLHASGPGPSGPRCMHERARPLVKRPSKSDENSKICGGDTRGNKANIMASRRIFSQLAGQFLC